MPSYNESANCRRILNLNRIMQGLALVDYDNMGGHKNKSKADVELHTAGFVDALACAFRATFPDVKELDIRFYGGWIDELGFLSPAALRLLQVLPLLRGRHHGLIVRPSLARTMIQFPEVVLQGTVRLRSRPRRQKMVDGMLGCDAMFVATKEPTQIGLITDDEDIIPAALCAHAANANPVVWMRSRLIGKGLNDQSLAERGLRIHILKENSHD